MKKILAILASVILLTACEKEINIDLNNSDPKIVIEGAVSNAAGPYYVRVSKTVKFSAGNEVSPVTGSIVSISDNLGNTETLIEASPGLYATNSTTGVPGRTYNLSVSAEGEVYTASSTMPLQVALDSLMFLPFSGPGGVNVYLTIPMFTDPQDFGNNYRFILTVNNVTDNSYIIANDNSTNGDANRRPIFSPNALIESADSVQVEMRCLDRASYDYFYTLSQIAGNGPGGGTTPSNPPNNISGNALGIFSAYTTQTKKQQVP
jgi:hypothetical protein